MDRPLFRHKGGKNRPNQEAAAGFLYSDCKMTQAYPTPIRARYSRFRAGKVDTKFVLRYNIVKYLQ